MVAPTVRRCASVLGFVTTFFLLVTSLYSYRLFFEENNSTYNFLKIVDTVMYRDVFDPEKYPNVSIGPDNLTDSDKYFIYRCDEATMRTCGGWADRMKGVMYAYTVANLTGRSFKMQMLFKSCDISQFIVPNKVNWSLPTSFHTKVSPNSNTSILNWVDKVTFINKADHDFLALPAMKAKYVYFKVNREPTRTMSQMERYKEQLAWMNDLSYPEILNTLYRRLFKPSTYLRTKVKLFLEKHLQANTKLVCAHIRLGSNPTIPRDSIFNFLPSQLRDAWDFIGNISEGGNSKVFLMSDSEIVLSQAKNKSYSDRLLFTPGKVVHVDRMLNLSAQEECDGLEKTLMEQLILMHCDVLIVSPSGLSRLAAYIRGTDNGLYYLKKSGEVVPSNREQLAQQQQ